ncbi:alpha/beta hydrolase [Hydrogenophaga palleronii]|uniref:alpha/beta hydrolase n=1 Tax=Hydrogenophaga palleronii TaxID=65655 RepID=UPI0008264384|nr:alpha/beta hydrolase [Hydrogenophaga palleronii]
MLNWQGDTQVVGQVRCRRFVPRSQADGAATGAVFEPLVAAAPSRIALIQHGGSSNKEGADVWDVAHALTRREGIRLVALDGPVHGARLARGEKLEPLDVRARFFEKWEHEPNHVEVHVDAWRGLIDELVDAWHPEQVSWVGLSMGTAYGLPLLARETARIHSAVIGMWGTSFVNSARLRVDAKAVRARVLFQQKWHDELFSRDGQLELFDALGTDDRRLHVYPGGHTRMGEEQLADLVRFVVN